MTRMDKILGFDAETGVLEVEAGRATRRASSGCSRRRAGFRPWCPAPACPPSAAPSRMTSTARTTTCSAASASTCSSVTLLQPGGARVEVTPEGNAALFRATIGGIGQTGVIVSAKLQMIPTPGQRHEGEGNPGREFRRIPRPARRLANTATTSAGSTAPPPAPRSAAASSRRPSSPAAPTRRAACRR